MHLLSPKRATRACWRSAGPHQPLSLNMLGHCASWRLESIHGNRASPDKIAAAQSGRALELLNQGIDMVGRQSADQLWRSRTSTTRPTHRHAHHRYTRSLFSARRLAHWTLAPAKPQMAEMVSHRQRMTVKRTFNR